MTNRVLVVPWSIAPTNLPTRSPIGWRYRAAPSHLRPPDGPRRHPSRKRRRAHLPPRRPSGRHRRALGRRNVAARNRPGPSSQAGAPTPSLRRHTPSPWRPAITEPTPLCPPLPRPKWKRNFPKGRSMSSWTSTVWSLSTLKYRISGDTAAPESFMNVVGSARMTRRPDRSRVATSARMRWGALPNETSPPIASATSSPRLCLVATYPEPGLRNPTTRSGPLSPGPRCRRRFRSLPRPRPLRPLRPIRPLQGPRPRPLPPRRPRSGGPPSSRGWPRGHSSM